MIHKEVLDMIVAQILIQHEAKGDDHFTLTCFLERGEGAEAIATQVEEFRQAFYDLDRMVTVKSDGIGPYIDTFEVDIHILKG